VFKLENGRLILEKQISDAVNTLENIAKKGSSVNRIDAHEYEEESEARSI